MTSALPRRSLWWDCSWEAPRRWFSTDPRPHPQSCTLHTTCSLVYRSPSSPHTPPPGSQKGSHVMLPSTSDSSVKRCKFSYWFHMETSPLGSGTIPKKTTSAPETNRTTCTQNCPPAAPHLYTTSSFYVSSTLRWLTASHRTSWTFFKWSPEQHMSNLSDVWEPRRVYSWGSGRGEPCWM